MILPMTSLGSCEPAALRESVAAHVRSLTRKAVVSGLSWGVAGGVAAGVVFVMALILASGV